MGFVEAAGFRAGTSRPYPLWGDSQSRRVTDVIERPLVLMDATVASYSEQSVDDPVTLDLVARLKQRCQQFGGDFVFLIHNCRVSDRGMRTFYRECLS